MKGLDMRVVSRLIAVLILSIVVGCLFFGMIKMSGRRGESQAEHIKRIIEKALVQCYALEGGYPGEIDYLEKYGVIFDNDSYIYDYTYIGSNIMPGVIIVPLFD